MYPDATKVKLVWHFLAFDKEMSSSRTPEQLESLRKEVILLIKKIEAEKKFSSKTSKLCDWCEFQSLCPEWKHEFETKELKVNEYLKEDGVKLVNEFVKLKQEHDKIDEKLEMIRVALISYAKKKDVNAVFGTNFRASVKAYPKLSFPKKGDSNQKKFFEAVKKIGLWDKLATVDVYSLAKMINNGEIHDDLVKILDKFITKGELVRIGLREK